MNADYESFCNYFHLLLPPPFQHNVINCLLPCFVNMCQVRVQVTLRPTVSRPVRLDLVPLLSQVPRFYVCLSDSSFLLFSCRAPSLTRGRVCNLQCNDASLSSNDIATNGQSAISSWCQAPVRQVTRF
jgi:hypothetical protein